MNIQPMEKVRVHGAPTLPAIYGESLSYGQEIGKIIYTVNELIAKCDDLEARVEELEERIINGANESEG